VERACNANGDNRKTKQSTNNNDNVSQKFLTHDGHRDSVQNVANRNQPTQVQSGTWLVGRRIATGADPVRT